jgi:hypothetical protein
MHDCCLNTGTNRSLRKGLLFTSLLVSACLLILAIGFLVKDHQKTPALAIMAVNGLFAVMIVGLWKPGLLDPLARPVFRGPCLGLLLAGLAWGVLCIGIAHMHTVNRWDEGAYLLSGLALRGYGTPYAAHRAPVTHLLAAVFAEVPWLINPVLLLGLVTLLTVWGRKHWGWPVAVMPLLLLIGQNVFLSAVLDVMAELPAALLLLSAFFLLADERFFGAGALFALAALARWNIAVIPGVLIPLVALRFGAQPMLRYVLGGSLIILAWLGLSYTLLDNPIERIYRANFLPAYEYAGLGHEKPDFLSRSRFYITHFYFLTPLAFFAMALRPFLPEGGYGSRSEDWVIRYGIPVGFLTYALTMMNVGAEYARFMAPIIPLAMFILTDAVMACCFAFDMGQRQRRSVLLIVGCLTLAWGLWPASVLLTLKSSLDHRDYFSQRFRAEVSKSVDKSATIFAPAIAPISSENGHIAMWELRRTLSFPNARRTPAHSILPEVDVQKTVAELVKGLGPGSIVIVPSAAAGGIEHAILVTADADWSLYQITKEGGR